MCVRARTAVGLSTLAAPVQSGCLPDCGSESKYERCSPRAPDATACVCGTGRVLTLCASQSACRSGIRGLLAHHTPAHNIARVLTCAHGLGLELRDNSLLPVPCSRPNAETRRQQGSRTGDGPVSLSQAPVMAREGTGCLKEEGTPLLAELGLGRQQDVQGPLPGLLRRGMAAARRREPPTAQRMSTAQGRPLGRKPRDGPQRALGLCESLRSSFSLVPLCPAALQYRLRAWHLPTQKELAPWHCRLSFCL